MISLFRIWNSKLYVFQHSCKTNCNSLYRFCGKGSSLTVAVEEMIEDKIEKAKVESIFDPLHFKALKEVDFRRSISSFTWNCSCALDIVTSQINHMTSISLLHQAPLTKDAIHLLSLNPSSRTSEQIQTVTMETIWLRLLVHCVSMKIIRTIRK